MSRHTSVVFPSQTVDAATATESVDLNEIEYGISFHVAVSAKAGLSGGTMTLQGSNDDTNWVGIASATNIADTGDEQFLLQDDAPSYRYARLAFAISAGEFVAQVIFSGVES